MLTAGVGAIVSYQTSTHLMVVGVVFFGHSCSGRELPYMVSYQGLLWSYDQILLISEHYHNSGSEGTASDWLMWTPGPDKQ